VIAAIETYLAVRRTASLSATHRISPAQLCKLRDCSKANLGDRRGNFLHEKFDLLGYGFQARRSKNHWGKFFVDFSPGVSNAATKQFVRRFAGGSCAVVSIGG